MKTFRILAAAFVIWGFTFAVPVSTARAADKGQSADHRQDGAHGHKGHKGGNSADHRKDGTHGHKGHKGGNSADHRKDGAHPKTHLSKK